MDNSIDRKITKEDIKKLGLTGAIQYNGYRAARMGKNLFSAIKNGFKKFGNKVADIATNIKDSTVEAARTVKNNVSDKFTLAKENIRAYSSDQLNNIVSKKEEKYQQRIDALSDVDINLEDQDYVKVAYNQMEKLKNKKIKVSGKRKMYYPLAIFKTMIANAKSKKKVNDYFKHLELHSSLMDAWDDCNEEAKEEFAVTGDSEDYRALLEERNNIEVEQNEVESTIKDIYGNFTDKEKAMVEERKRKERRKELKSIYKKIDSLKSELHSLNKRGISRERNKRTETREELLAYKSYLEGNFSPKEIEDYEEKKNRAK